MKKLTSEEIKNELLEKFPEFKESDEFIKSLDQEGGSYEYFARFADFITKSIDQGTNTELIKNFFSFINEIYSRENFSGEVWDLLGIEILETLGAEAKYSDLANEYLEGSALKAFQGKSDRPKD